MGRFINPFTDYGFKFLFGREVEKELLISFLNDLLVGEHVITDIQFLNNEQQPEVKNERGIIYDIYCMTDTGERIIVEMPCSFLSLKGHYATSQKGTMEFPVGCCIWSVLHELCNGQGHACNDKDRCCLIRPGYRKAL